MNYTRSASLSVFYGVCLFGFAMAAEPVRLDANALHAAYEGKTHLSFYRHAVDDYGGLAFEESYHLDGSLTYRAGNVMLSGRWRIEGDAICFDYPDSPLAGACFAVEEEAGCYYSYQIGANGRPEGVERGGWWIRSHIDGNKPACAVGDLTS